MLIRQKEDTALQKKNALFHVYFFWQLSSLKNTSNVFYVRFDLRFFGKIPELAILHFPNVLIKAPIITLVEIFMQFDPLGEMLFQESSCLFVDIEMIKN